MVNFTIYRPTIARISQTATFRVPCRYKSITASIERGKRSSDFGSEGSRSGRRDFRERNDQQPNDYPRTGRSQWQGEYSQSSSRFSQGRDSREEYRGRPDNGRRRANFDESMRIRQDTPSLPYTTAASEFIYGYSSVLAALKANRRRLYALHVHTRGANRTGIGAILTKARALRIGIHEVEDDGLRAMDKASSGRPHNGLVLEASSLPVPPITTLSQSSIDINTFGVELDQQTHEDKLVNGTQTEYTFKSAGWRHPLILYVDGVLDEGNLGAIARSAYFLGVDALITPARNSAPWSHIALKASAGAAEAIPIFKVNQAADFLGRSARAGWRIYASDAIPAVQPDLASASPDPSIEESASNVVYTQARSAKRLPADHCPVANHPTILMMGAEGTGLRSSLLNTAHYKVGIRHGREVDEVGVDSLNVSVAASLLCSNMLQRPQAKPTTDMLF